MQFTIRIEQEKLELVTLNTIFSVKLVVTAIKEYNNNNIINNYYYSTINLIISLKKLTFFLPHVSKFVSIYST
jgi:hypothetical protein